MTAIRVATFVLAALSLAISCYTVILGTRTRRRMRKTDAAMEKEVFDLALQVADKVFGEGAYAKMHANNPNPAIQAAIARAKEARRDRPERP